MFLFLTFALTSNAQEEQYGLASFYADAFQGQKAASGIKYDKNKLTCAHNDYPFGSTLRVTHLENKKSVTVKVIDRGPYIKGRIVDLSRAAAQRIGLINDGIAQVKVELVKDGANDKLTSKGDNKPAAAASSSTRRSNEAKFKSETARTESTRGGNAKSKAKVKKTTPPAATSSAIVGAAKEAKVITKKKEKKADTPTPYSNEIEVPAIAAQMMNAQDFKNSDLYQISLIKPKKEGFGVQVISLSDYESVLKKVAELQGRHFKNILIKTNKEEGKSTYKIILGQFETLDQAKNYQKNLKKNKKISGFVVPLEEVVEKVKK